MKHTHLLKLPLRTVTFVIEELPDCVKVSLLCSQSGDFGDTDELERMIMPLIEKYDTDYRPIVFTNTDSGEVATIVGDAHSCAYVIRKPMP